MNGSITITKEDNTINLLMGINQRLMSEYDVINWKTKKIRMLKSNIIIIVIKEF